MSTNDPSQSPYGPPEGQGAPNPYGQQPADPYGQEPGGTPYGQQYGQPYGQPGAPYGAPAGQQPYGAAPAAWATPIPYATWLQRVGSYLIDGIVSGLATLPMFVGLVLFFGLADTTTDAQGEITELSMTGGAWVGVAVMVLGGLFGLAFQLWNIVFRQGRTGYSIGKSVLGIRLIKESTGEPAGPALAFGRQLAHIIDGMVCYLGYLWPLWDAKRQTLADKICSTVVIQQPKG